MVAAPQRLLELEITSESPMFTNLTLFVRLMEIVSPGLT